MHTYSVDRPRLFREKKASSPIRFASPDKPGMDSVLLAHGLSSSLGHRRGRGYR
jgi:hypothetical protein